MEKGNRLSGAHGSIGGEPLHREVDPHVLELVAQRDRGRAIAGEDGKLLEKRALHALVIVGLPVALYVARQFYKGRDARVASGANLGLFKAATSFNPEIGFFRPHVRRRVTGEILTTLRDEPEGSLDLPQVVHEARSIVRRVRDALPPDAQQGLTVPKLAEAADLSSELVTEVLRDTSQPLSLDAPLPSGEDTLGTTLNAGSLDIGEHVAMKDLLQRAIGALSERERKIVSLRYWQDMTWEEVGKSLGIGVSRVRTLHDKLLAKMRAENKIE